jgi:hypothetical protein
VDVRHEGAVVASGGERPSPLTLSQQGGGAEGSQSREVPGRMGAALTKPGRASTARWCGSGERDGKEYDRSLRLRPLSLTGPESGGCGRGAVRTLRGRGCMRPGKLPGGFVHDCQEATVKCCGLAVAMTAAGLPLVERATFWEYPDPRFAPWFRTAGIWAVADPGRRFDDLFNFVHDPVTLFVSFARVAGSTGANTPGVDGLTVDTVDGSRPQNRFQHQLQGGLDHPIGNGEYLDFSVSPNHDLSGSIFDAPAEDETIRPSLMPVDRPGIPGHRRFGCLVILLPF